MAAHNIIQASDQITFSNGFITDSEGVQDDELKTVLASLKQKGMPVSPNFKPSLDIALTGNAQTDSENMMVMIRDGYKVKLQATDGGSTEEEARAEVSFANVFLSLRELLILQTLKILAITVGYPSLRNRLLQRKITRSWVLFLLICNLSLLFCCS